jgi:rhodanese-related sulfurtransferase
VKTLNDMGLTRASHIETGFNGWKSDGLPITSYEDWQAARRG